MFEHNEHGDEIRTWLGECNPDGDLGVTKFMWISEVIRDGVQVNSTWGAKTENESHMVMFDWAANNPPATPVTIKHDTEHHFYGVYQVTREWGGAEEGGWYWTRREWLEAVAVVALVNCGDLGDYLQSVMAEKHGATGDIYSVNGGAALEIKAEAYPHEHDLSYVPYS